MASEDIQDLLTTYEARLAALPLLDAARVPNHRHSIILKAWSNAVHHILDKYNSKELSNLPLGATRDTTKAWATDITQGKQDPGPSSCASCNPGSDDCWRCQLEAQIVRRLEIVQKLAEDSPAEVQAVQGAAEKITETITARKNDAVTEEATPMEQLLAKLPPEARARLEAAKEKNNVVSMESIDGTALIARYNLSPRDALGADNPERIIGLMLYATAKSGACGGQCQDREYIACLCSLNFGPEHYHSNVLQKWSAHNRALQVDMLFFDNFMDFKIRRSMYEGCKVCRPRFLMATLPLNKRYCKCDWDRDDQAFLGVMNRLFQGDTQSGQA